MRIGILGGGQLARMLALAGYPLGMSFSCIETKKNTSASFVTNVSVIDWENEQQLKNFAQNVDVITYETENIPLQTAFILQQYCSLFPSIEILKIAQDRLSEKKLCQQLNIPTSRFTSVSSYDELKGGISSFGYPAVLKTRRMGYDGKGQIVIKKDADVFTAWEELKGQDLVLESWIPFSREISLIAVRDCQGNVCFYPLIENTHIEGILHLSIAPYKNENLFAQAQEIATKIMSHVNYVGVLVIEFFQLGNQLLVNEMAPRVHNSGHWTIEGADTSQFENHLRAIAGLPLGSTQLRGYSAMLNVLSSEPPLHAVLSFPGIHYHTYQKSASSQRKLGHITLVRGNEQQLKNDLALLTTLIISK